MKRIMISFVAMQLCLISFAANVDTVSVLSIAMQKEIKTAVVTPSGYNDNINLPVLYLLHGYSGNFSSWIQDNEVKQIADKYQMIIVLPDGDYDSWYFDSVVDSTSRYETFISKELIRWIDEKYATISSRDGRAIAGLSMGGHGALYVAFRNQSVFGACGSMSGGVDLKPFPNNWNISKKLGKYKNFPKRWEENSVIGMLHLLEPNSLKIIIDCGTEDFFYEVNKKLHQELLYRNIPHDYISRPGKHNWDYWKNAIKYQALFFHEYFNKK